MQGRSCGTRMLRLSLWDAHAHTTDITTGNFEPIHTTELAEEQEIPEMLEGEDAKIIRIIRDARNSIVGYRAPFPLCAEPRRTPKAPAGCIGVITCAAAGGLSFTQTPAISRRRPAQRRGRRTGSAAGGCRTGWIGIRFPSASGSFTPTQTVAGGLCREEERLPRSALRRGRAAPPVLAPHAVAAAAVRRRGRIPARRAGGGAHPPAAAAWVPSVQKKDPNTHTRARGGCGGWRGGRERPRDPHSAAAWGPST